MTPDLLGVIYAGMYQYSDMSVMQHNCPTGNCAYQETYTSLGVCGKCYNVTEHIQRSCGTAPLPAYENPEDATLNVEVPDCNYTLSKGLLMSGTPGLNITTFCEPHGVRH